MLFGKTPDGEINTITNPSVEEAKEAALQWLTYIASCLTPEDYDHIPKIAGVVHAGGIDVVEAMRVAAVATDTEDQPFAGLVELMVGGGLAVFQLKREQEIPRPIYSYFLVADGFNTKDDNLVIPKKKWWQRKKPVLTLQDEFSKGNPVVQESLSIYHITRTYVTVATMSYRHHPVDGFEWDTPVVHSFDQDERDAPHLLWGYGPWTD